MDDIIEENLSELELSRVIKDLTTEYNRLDMESKSINESRQELKRYAKKKGINLKAFEESYKKFKEPRDERENKDADVAKYLNIMED
jgi:uncharacterized protein (UPF0335 family)